MNLIRKQMLTIFSIAIFSVTSVNTFAKENHIEHSTSIKVSKDAWTSLVGERFSSRPEFAFIKNHHSLPNVLIYGDSISIHYTQQVRENLENKANVYRLYRNGSDSGGFIAKMNKMNSIMQDTTLKDHWSFNWDVIHFNVGLHDLKYVKNGKLDKINGKQVTTIEQYQKNLRNIISYLKQLSPNAKLIFATTTPVPEGAQGRFSGDAVKYNTAAYKVLKDFPEVQINDLYQLTKPNHAEWWIRAGDVHYNNKGTKAQAKQVSNVILTQKIFN